MVRLVAGQGKAQICKYGSIVKTYKIEINGQVQGVGFRPFIYNLAQKLELKGHVYNNHTGVLISTTCTKATIEKFLEDIQNNSPKASVIDQMSLHEVPYEDYEDFRIKPNAKGAQLNLPLTPDFAICDSCKSEILDPNNRRYQYAFTTCVHCGPRYAITQNYPFERHHTSLASFEMCPKCAKEYAYPQDIRFHSQTNSCGTCGIQLQLYDNDHNLIGKTTSGILETVQKHLSAGAILAIKNTSGYLLCCNANTKRAIQNLRAKKKRPNKPFAILYPSIEQIKKEFRCSTKEIEALQSSIAPIVLLKNTQHTRLSTSSIAPNLKHTGVMLPNSALLYLLSNSLKAPLVATSANIHKSPIIAENDEVAKQLKDVYDIVLHHNLPIKYPQDDSVLKYAQNNRLVLRRSRGMSPSHIGVSLKTRKCILAMGSNLKSTFTLGLLSRCYTSQYFGDLDAYEVFSRYKSSINSYLSLFEAKPDTIIIDTNLQYQSSMLGEELAEFHKADVVNVQHHKAHFASVLGEHSLFESKDKVLGVVWDGTGLGEDNQIWGGEFFCYQDREIKRLTHLDYFNWIAGDKMAKEPRLSLFCILDKKEKCKEKFSNVEWKLYNQILQNNTLKTSSIGRLFDAAASALLDCNFNTFEAEASMILERVAADYKGKSYIDLLAGAESISGSLLLDNLISEKEKGTTLPRLAASFLYTLALVVINLSKAEDIKTIACSGGVFQNAELVNILSELASKEAKYLKINRNLSTNDENISFGQLMYYEHCII